MARHRSRPRSTDARSTAMGAVTIWLANEDTSISFPEVTEQPDQDNDGGQGERNQRPRFRGYRRALRFLAWVTGALFATVAIGAVLLGWRLSEGPLRVSFLTPYLQQSVLQLPEGWSITIGETFIDWDGRAAIVRIRTEDVGFINANSQKVLSVPVAGFTIHGDALLAGRIEPKDLTTSDMRLVLTRSEDGNWRLGTGVRHEEQTTAPAGDAGRGVAELAEDLFGTSAGQDGSSGMLGRVSQFTLRDSAVSVVDQPNGRIYQIDARELSLRGTAAGISVKADADVSTRDLTVPLAGSLIYRPEVQEVAGNLRFGEVEVQNAVIALGGPAALKGIDLPISGTAGFRVSPTTGVSPMRVEIRGGEGTFALPGILQDPLPVRSIMLSGEFDPARLLMEVEKLEYDAGDFVAVADGRFQMTEEGPAVHLGILSERVPLLRVPAYWPVGNGVAIRDWLVQNIGGGVGLNVTARMNMTPEMWSMPAPPREAFDVDFEFEAADVRLPEPFDRVTDGSGRLQVTGRELAITLTEGNLGPLVLKEGTVEVADFEAKPAILDATFVSEGSIADTMKAVIRGPIAERNKGLDRLSGVAGKAEVLAQVSVPLSANAKLSDATFAASADLTDVVANNIIGSVSAQSEKLELTLDGDAAEVRGAVLLGDTNIDLKWVERFAAEAPIVREVGFSGRAGISDLRALGLEAPEGVSGTVGATGFVHFAGKGHVSGEIDADLTGLAIVLPGIPWSKSAESEGTLRTTFVRQADGPLTLEGLKSQSAGLSLQGDLTLSAEGRLLSTRMERLDFAGSQLSLIARQAANEPRWQVQLSGQRLDLRPWRALPPTPDEDESALDGASIDLSVDELVASENVRIHQLSGKVTMGEPLPTGALTGLINGEAEMKATASTDRAGWRFTLTSQDAGSVLSAFGLGNAIRKGRMNVHGVSTDQDTLTGLATIDDFTLTETPAFARLISLASFTGIGEALSGRGLSFSRAEVPFTYANDRIDIRKGRMAGPSVGLTAEGYYEFEADQLRFVGNLIPAYSISQVLGQIPLLGAILGGDQGLFGVTYVVEGPSSAPEVSVNPLSALAPGILRRMFLQPVEEQEIQVPTNEEVQNER